MQPVASKRSGGKTFEFVPVAGSAGGLAMLDVEIWAIGAVVETSTTEVVVVGAVVVVVADGTVVVVAGGVVYSIGAVIFWRRWHPFSTTSWGFHETFHLCTVIDASLHFVAVAVTVL